MPAPTSYTEAELKAEAHAELGGWASSLGWTVLGGSYDGILTRALQEYGVATVEEISGLLQAALILNCVFYHLWMRVTGETNPRFDITDAGTQVKLASMNDHARASAKEYLARITQIRCDIQRTDGALIRTYDVTRTDDPYEPAAATDEYAEETE